MTLRTISIMLLVLVTTALSACGGRQTHAETGASAERAPISTMVRPRAAYELRCDATRIDIEEIGRGTYAASGCGASATYTCMGSMGQYACQREGDVEGELAATPPPLTGRDVTHEGAPIRDIVLPRATHELSCDEAEVEVHEVASKTYVASGCGQQILYACMGAMGQYRCQRE